MLIVCILYSEFFFQIFHCLDVGDKLITNLLQHEFFFIQNQCEDNIILSVSGFIQSVMEFKLFRVVCHTFFGVS